MHFLALPIEDPFLDHFAHSGSAHSASASTAHTNGAAGAGGASRGSGSQAVATSTSASALPLPFSDSGNPILAQVAFLAATVSPAVAAAAAQAAIQFYTHAQPAADSNQHDDSSMDTDEPDGDAAANSAAGTAEVNANNSSATDSVRP